MTYEIIGRLLWCAVYVYSDQNITWADKALADYNKRFSK